MTGVDLVPCYSIPTLDQVIKDDHLGDCGPYNRTSFLRFMRTSHCMENLEFFVEVDRLLRSLSSQSEAYLSNSSILKNLELEKHWLLIYRLFLARNSAKEVNLPHKVALRFLPHILPSNPDLIIIRKLGYELLMDTYNDFISYTRESINDRTTRRRCLDLLAAEVTSRDLAQLIPRLSVAIINESSQDLGIEWEKALQVCEEARKGNPLCSNCASVPLNVPLTDTFSTLATHCITRCSSIGTFVDNIKGYSGWNRTKKRLRLRHSPQEKVDTVSQNSS